MVTATAGKSTGQYVVNVRLPPPCEGVWANTSLAGSPLGPPERVGRDSFASEHLCNVDRTKGLMALGPGPVRDVLAESTRCKCVVE